MTFTELSKARGPRVALIVLGASVVVLGWSLVRAFRGEPMPVGETRTLASMETMRRPVARPPADIQTAVDNDLFSEDRSAPSESYRMPGETSDDKPVVEPMKPNVLGTAVATDGRNFATLKLGDSSPQLVRVGDKIGEWVVRGIARGKVVLVSNNGTRAELTVTKPGT
ncbi:MAG TPA: hypothetical protein VGM50_14500 [Gemmatimonadaceae bacterium]